jgi:hypothetical protein
MHKIFLIANYLIVFLLFFSGCKILKSRNYLPFEVSDASYYSWFAKGNESGTNIQIKLRNVDPEVKFDSLIFRNVRVPVFTSMEGSEILLETIIPGDNSQLGIEKADISNQLIYTYRGRKRVYILNNIRREKMRYYL